MGQLWEYVKMALANIRMNRGRSFLTMLGIIIGGIIGDSDHVGGQWSQDGDGAGADSCGRRTNLYLCQQ